MNGTGKTANGVTSQWSIIHENNLMFIWCAWHLWTYCCGLTWVCVCCACRKSDYHLASYVMGKLCYAIRDVHWPCAESPSCRVCCLYFVLAYQWPLALPRMAARLYSSTTLFIYLCLTFILSFLTLNPAPPFDAIETKCFINIIYVRVCASR